MKKKKTISIPEQYDGSDKNLKSGVRQEDGVGRLTTLLTTLGDVDRGQEMKRSKGSDTLNMLLNLGELLYLRIKVLYFYVPKIKSQILGYHNDITSSDFLKFKVFILF